MPRSRDGRWTANCKLCGELFTPRKPSQEFCSQACSNKAFPGAGGRKPAAGLERRPCIVCGTEFQPYRAPQVTCSAWCYRRSPAGKASFEREHARRRDDPEAAAQVRKYNRLHNLRRNYGLTVEEHDAKLAAQSGVCMICSRPPKPDGVRAASRLHVDHDHVTNRVRDLLCNDCNRGIGSFKENPALMRLAAEYIERHRAELGKG